MVAILKVQKIDVIMETDVHVNEVILEENVNNVKLDLSRERINVWSAAKIAINVLHVVSSHTHVCYETLLLESRGIAGRRFLSLAQFFILCLPILWWNKMAAHQNDIKTSSKISDQSQAI